ncbi:MAG: antitermination protein NusG [Erysipelotrichaceae bacterium]|nr:antitermination protein NusG [Erysipelotrichaceae bacterium]
MNYYVLYCQTLKCEGVCRRLNGKGKLQAFIPQMESYHRLSNQIMLKTMFPGYVFIKSELNQSEFDALLSSLSDERNGIIKELKKSEVSALTQDEIDLYQRLWNQNGILVMSEGYKENGKTIVTKGPLLSFQEEIIATDKRDMVAVLKLTFLDRNIKAGILLK